MLKKLAVLTAVVFAAVLSCAALFPASAKTACLSGISLASGADAQKTLEKSGFGTVMMWNLNPGSDENGQVLLGYRTGGTPITGIIVTPNSGAVIKDKNNVSYSLASAVSVSSGACVYVTTDKNAGDPIVSLDIARSDSQSDGALCAIAGNGAETVRDLDGKPADLGSGSGTVYLRIVRSGIVKPFISGIGAVTGSDRTDAVYQAAAQGFDYYSEGDLIAGDDKYTVFAYHRTRDPKKAVRGIAALREGDAKGEMLPIGHIAYQRATETVRNQKIPYVLYSTTDSRAGNPVIDVRVGENTALSDCPMSIWLRGYYAAQTDLPSVYAQSEELYAALEKDDTVYTLLPVSLTAPDSGAQTETTAAKTQAAAKAGTGTSDSAQNPANLLPLSVLVQKDGLSQESLALIEAANNAVMEEETAGGSRLSSVFQDSKHHSFLLIGAIVVVLAGTAVFFYWRGNKRAEAAAKSAPEKDAEPISSAAQLHTKITGSDHKPGRGLKSFLIVLTAIPLLTAAFSHTLTADAAVAPPDSGQEWTNPATNGAYRLTPYYGAKPGAPDHIDISKKRVTVTQDAYYTSSVDFADVSVKTPDRKTNGMVTISGSVTADTPLRIYNTSDSVQTITLFLDNADIQAARWCTCAILQGKAQINLNVIYKGACKMTGYNFAPFKINGNTNVSFHFIQFDHNASLTLQSEFDQQDRVCQDGGITSIAYHDYDDVTKELVHWQDGVAGCLDVSKLSATVVATPEGVRQVKNDRTLYAAIPSGGDSGWNGVDLFYSATDSIKNAVVLPMTYTGENAVPPAANTDIKSDTLKIYSVTLNDAQISAVDAAKLVGFRNTNGRSGTGTDGKASVTKAPDKAAGAYLTDPVSVKALFGKIFFLDSLWNPDSSQNAYQGHWETGKDTADQVSELTAHKGAYRLTGSANRDKPVMVFSNFTGKPHTFDVETDRVSLTTAKDVSPFVVKGNAPVTLNIIGSGVSDFEANGTGVIYAASNIKVTVNIFKVDAQADVLMKNSATRLRAVSCGPYAAKLSSTVQTESADFYSYSSGSITKKEDGTFHLSGGSVLMTTKGVTQTHRNLYWYDQGAAAHKSFDPAYLAKTAPAINYQSLLTLKGSLTKDSLLLVNTGEKRSAASEFSVLLSAVSFTGTTDSSPVIVTGKNDAVINLFYSGKNTLSFAADAPMVDIRTDNSVKVRVNLIKTDAKAQINHSGQAVAGMNALLPQEGLDQAAVSARAADITCVETTLGKGGAAPSAENDSDSLTAADGVIFTPEGFTTGTSSTAYVDQKHDAAVHAAKEPYYLSAVNAGDMKNPLIFYNTNTEPVTFTLHITDPAALFQAKNGTPAIIACGKSGVILNIVCADKCTLQGDGVTVLAKDGVDLTINEKRSGSNGKLTLNGSGVTDGGIYSLNLADNTASNKLTVKLTCTDDAGGWNKDGIASELRDSFGKIDTTWTVNRKSVDDEKESLSYTYDIGSSLPAMFVLKPDFGGGVTFRSYKVRLEATLNGKSILNQERGSRSYPFKHSGDMTFTFDNTGFARVAVADSSGNYRWKNYDSVKSAWDAAQSSDKVGLIQLTSSWTVDSRLILGEGKKVKLDLGGYVIRRNANGLTDDGEVIKINSGAVLDVVDTCPDRNAYNGFNGGGIVGGRSTDGGGNIHISGGTLNMTGGCLYDGRCNEDGGGIYLDNGAANLKNVVIRNCEAEKSTWVDNEGGAVYVKNESSRLTLDHCRIESCKAYDYGGAIMVDEGKVKITDSVITDCYARDNDGGAINAENDTELYIRGSEITNCSADERGGAVFIDSEDGTWLIDTKITGCRSGDHGGGVYINDDNTYMEDVVITGNTAKGEGGGVFVESFDDIDIAGESIIKDNKGKNGRNDLTLDQDVAKAYLYNQGLEGNACIKICSDDTGGETLTKFPMSKYQFDNYIHASLDGHCLQFDTDSSATEKNRGNSRITASVFTDLDGNPVFLTAAALLAAFMAVAVLRHRKKGGT